LAFDDEAASYFSSAHTMGLVEFLYTMQQGQLRHRDKCKYDDAAASAAVLKQLFIIEYNSITFIISSR
jgi:uncharacterized protein